MGWPRPAPRRGLGESRRTVSDTYVSWMVDDGHSADKLAFWIGDTPATVGAVYPHMLEASSAPAAASIEAAVNGLC